MTQVQSVDDHRRVFHVLDFIRGIAAIAVMQRHVAMKIDSHVHGTFLAVDLFFVLSGFVMAHAYERRLLSGLSIRRFMMLRLIRLWPLYALGLVLGCIELALVSPLVRAALPTSDLLVGVLLGILMMPPLGYPPLDLPRWSLFYELVANLGHAALLRRITIGGILGIAVCSATCLLIAFMRGAQIDSGWLPNDIGIGLGRVGYSYCAGVLLYRMRSGILSRQQQVLWGLWAATLAAIGAVTLSRTTAAEFAFILIAFPILVHVASKIETGRMIERVCVFFGVTSYALYILHEPIANLLQDSLTLTGIKVNNSRILGFLFLFSLLLLTWLLDKFYDKYARDWLRYKLIIS